MTETFKLKPIHRDAIDEALRKAEQYRLLNQPGQAESICRDILRVDADNQRALTIIILALTDQFGRSHGSPSVKTAREYTAKLSDEYQRLYYGGLICERQARARLQRGMAGAFAYGGLREAMELYERAERVRPAGNDDAILRWNSCVRTIRRRNLEPQAAEEEPLLE
ncbi:MAG TPA: hypothetical protein VD788_01530 [Candidatus Polarisedimenticolaceae bacterium]|nr:hypothetical protein [Candidatus Polarisedimenticolaceae bacterium]